MEEKSTSRRGHSALLHYLTDRPALLWLLFAFTVRLLVGIILHVYSVSRGFDGLNPMLSSADDRMYWYYPQYLLAGITPGKIFCPYPYVLAFLFALVGPSLIAGKLLNIVLGSLIVSIGVLIARELTAERPYNWRELRHPVNLAGLFLTIYPSAVFHSTQLLRDSLVVFLGIAAIYFALRIIRGYRGVWPWFGYGLALTLFYAFRPYAAFALAVGFTLYLLYCRQTISAVLISIFYALVAPWLTGWGPFAWLYVSPSFIPGVVSNFREEVYAIGGSAIGVTVDFASIHGFMWTYAYSFFTAMFGPFLWQLRSPVVAIGLVESLPMLLLIPVWVKGIWRLLTRKSGEAGFLLFISLLLVGAIALFSANIGANVRLRLLPWNAFLIFAAVQLGERLQKK